MPGRAAVRDGFPSAVITAVPDPTGEILDGGAGRFESHCRGLSYRVGLYRDDASPAAKSGLNRILFARPLHTIELQDHAEHRREWNVL